jgi:prepilin-type N-terminal cleavage/methylation domain-containing protein
MVTGCAARKGCATSTVRRAMGGGGTNMKIAKRQRNKGLTLIELMVVVLIISVAVIGAMGFRFYCVSDAKKADVQVNAARIASMILENWKGMGGTTSYNPADTDPANGDLKLFSSQFTIEKNGSTYRIQDLANGVWYEATLLYTAGTLPTPNRLNVSVLWRRGYSNDTSQPTEHTISMTTYAD